VRILLDTHVWLWVLSHADRFSTAGRACLEDSESVFYLSAVAPWDIAIKHRLGKLTLPTGGIDTIRARLAESPAMPLPIAPAHAFRVAELPMHHRDPFDRLLIAQAQVEGLTIMTNDPTFRAYDVALVGV
jgi:PIN domain nuclease of toxin-antitoxin system